MSRRWPGRLRWARTACVLEVAGIGIAHVAGALSRDQAVGWYIGVVLGSLFAIAAWWLTDLLEYRRRACGAVSPQWGFTCDQRVWRHKRKYHTAGLWRWSR